MTTSPSSAPPVPDEQLIRTFAWITVAFCGVLVLISAVGVFGLVPDGVVRGRGVVIGLALGLVSWFASRWVVRHALSAGAGRGRGTTSDAAVLGAAVFRAIAAAEAPALAGFAFAVVDGSDLGPVVIAIPLAIVAIIVNASGPRAVRGHLARLRA